jgi:hypothetical protein
MSAQTDARLSEADLAYVRSEYDTLDELCARSGDPIEKVRAHIDAGRLPAPSYVLPDGTEMFPPDYFALLDEAGGVEGLRDLFDRRWMIAASTLGLVGVTSDEDWRDYLSGEFGVCLREVTPEGMVEKGALIAEIEGLTATPLAGDENWREQLRNAVDRLDEIERPFTDFDRQRWGTVSRDRYVTAVRAQHLSD